MVIKVSGDSTGIANEIKTIISMNKKSRCRNVPIIIDYNMMVLKNFNDKDPKK